MIRKLFKKIKVFFKLRKQLKEVSKICQKPVFIKNVGYMPCCRCSGCKEYIFLVKTQKELEKINPKRKWEIVF